MKRRVLRDHNLIFRFILFASCLLFFSIGTAQVNHSAGKDSPPQPRNIKIKEEHKDNKGNLVRTIEYDQGQAHYTETVVIPPKVSVSPRMPINPDTVNKDSVLVV